MIPSKGELSGTPWGLDGPWGQTTPTRGSPKIEADPDGIRLSILVAFPGLVKARPEAVTPTRFRVHIDGLRPSPGWAMPPTPDDVRLAWHRAVDHTVVLEFEVLQPMRFAVRRTASGLVIEVGRPPPVNPGRRRTTARDATPLDRSPATAPRTVDGDVEADAVARTQRALAGGHPALALQLLDTVHHGGHAASPDISWMLGRARLAAGLPLAAIHPLVDAILRSPSPAVTADARRRVDDIARRIPGTLAAADGILMQTEAPVDPSARAWWTFESSRALIRADLLGIASTRLTRLVETPRFGRRARHISAIIAVALGDSKIAIAQLDVLGHRATTPNERSALALTRARVEATRGRIDTAWAYFDLSLKSAETEGQRHIIRRDRRWLELASASHRGQLELLDEVLPVPLTLEFLPELRQLASVYLAACQTTRLDLLASAVDALATAPTRLLEAVAAERRVHDTLRWRSPLTTREYERLQAEFEAHARSARQGAVALAAHISIDRAMLAARAASRGVVLPGQNEHAGVRNGAWWDPAIASRRLVNHCPSLQHQGVEPLERSRPGSMKEE